MQANGNADAAKEGENHQQHKERRSAAMPGHVNVSLS
jgi:hypothetical protein